MKYRDSVTITRGVALQLSANRAGQLGPYASTSAQGRRVRLLEITGSVSAMCLIALISYVSQLT